MSTPILSGLINISALRTLVLLDEPEAHLHPPLLSAFTRALSDLLIYRNGVAIIATHSPVVLQEVPKSCVWKLRRSGFEVSVEFDQRATDGDPLDLRSVPPSLPYPFARHCIVLTQSYQLGSIRLSRSKRLTRCT